MMRVIISLRSGLSSAVLPLSEQELVVIKMVSGKEEQPAFL